MANVSGGVQIETRRKHELSIPFQSVTGDQSLNVGTLLTFNVTFLHEKEGEQVGSPLCASRNPGGYFTSADAKSLGYDYPHQHFHVKRENWVRVGQGIYRLKNFPSTGHEDLIRWWLWSRKKGAISHESAAAVYDLGDVLPARTHLTVPPDFRKKAAAGVVLYKALLGEKDVEMREGFRVTTPLRTILDLARGHLDQERLTAVTRDAMRKGLLDRRTLLNILAKTPKDIAPSEQVTLQLALREE